MTPSTEISIPTEEELSMKDSSHPQEEEAPIPGKVGAAMQNFPIQRKGVTH